MQAGREIKVKAWDDKTKRMYDGDAIEAYDYLITGLSYGKVIVAVEDPIWRELTVIEFTGLRDKNGKEIYEGDILRHPELYETPENTEAIYQTSGCIEFSSGSWVFSDDGSSLHEEYESYSGDFEVVGNVYENPELLEVGN